MSLIKPFRGLRPVPEHATDVAAPPYDVLNTAEARDRVAGKPLSFLHISKPEIDLPAGTTIPAVVRGDEVIIAHHDTMIREHDHVILFVPDKRQIAAVERLFQVGAIFV